jgi:peptidase E
VNLKATALIYSSHNRCEHLHRDWIVQRALEHPHNKSILYLPFGMESRDSQEFSWGTFKWYFDQFIPFGLNAMVFFWSDDLSRHDAELFFNMVDDAEVVILGGGEVNLGFRTLRCHGRLFLR